MKPGDKVVCVDNSPNKKTGRTCPLILNQVYVVQSIGEDEDGVFVNVLGVPMPICPHWFYPGFAIRRFRKLDELKQEASRQLVTTNPTE